MKHKLKWLPSRKWLPSNKNLFAMGFSKNYFSTGLKLSRGGADNYPIFLFSPPEMADKVTCASDSGLGAQFVSSYKIN
jgi:hypothetical protein